jgi:CheY-like chemotaxis protein
MARETRTLLVVDSSATSLFYWGMLLKRLEYMVMPMRNAEAALRAMEGVVPALVVTDRVLSGMSGTELLQTMKRDPRLKDVPVVMLTAQEDREAQEACRRLGCAAWFSKAVEPDVLYRMLQSLSESTPRRNIRLNTSLKVVVGDGSVTGGAERTEYATAISEGGLYVRTQYPQPRNAQTPVRIHLESGIVRAKAVVLYSYAANEGPYGEPGMGIGFVEIDERDRAAIRAFIKEQLTKDIAR